jgi:ribosomal protein S18 acetylase RimI-like enzyme
MTPHRLSGPEEAAEVLALLRAAFAGMAGRIDPPSSLDRMEAAGLVAADQAGEVWVIGRPPRACMVLTAREGALYLGKLAVAEGARGQGHARALVDHAAARARALGLPAVELQTRVELTENHAIFRALGFAETGRSAHPGYSRPTNVTFRLAAG